MSAPEVSSRQAAYLVAALACLGLAIGSLGPWEATLAGTQSGIDGGGLCTLILGAMALLLLIPRSPWPIVVALLGALSLGVAVVNVVDIAGATREPVGLAPPSVEVDWGLWLASISALALLVAAVVLSKGATRSERPPGSPSKAGAWGAWIRANPAIFGLVLLLVVGAVLRVWLTLAWSPAFTGYSDSGIYFQGAFESIWSDPIRMVGYSMFLETIHAVVPDLIAVVLVQHAMGLGAAVLIFLAVRRCGGPGWLGLFPAAVIAIGGDELILEHAALSDALFIFLIVATLYAAVRASEDRVWWAAAAGLLGGLAVWDRTVGLGLVAVVAIWLVFSRGRPTRQTLMVGGVSLAVALVVVGAYAGWRAAAADLPGALTSNNAWNLYGRVAPWADCEEFEPPAGSAGLCEATPPSERGIRTGEEYIYSGESPAQRLYGPPYLLSDPAGMERLQEWSEAAVRGQPLDYLNAVWLDSLRLFEPMAPSYGDLTADAFTSYVIYGLDGRSGRNEFVEYWQSLLYPDEGQPHHGEVGAFETWEAITRIVNLWMVGLLALCLAGPWVLRGRPRAGMILFALTGLMLLFFPIVTKAYDYRFTIPAFAPLVAAGALAAWGLGTAAAESKRWRRWVGSTGPPGDTSSS